MRKFDDMRIILRWTLSRRANTFNYLCINKHSHTHFHYSVLLVVSVVSSALRTVVQPNICRICIMHMWKTAQCCSSLKHFPSISRIFWINITLGTRLGQAFYHDFIILMAFCCSRSRVHRRIAVSALCFRLAGRQGLANSTTAAVLQCSCSLWEK